MIPRRPSRRNQTKQPRYRIELSRSPGHMYWDITVTRLSDGQVWQEDFWASNRLYVRLATTRIALDRRFRHRERKRERHRREQQGYVKEK